MCRPPDLGAAGGFVGDAYDADGVIDEWNNDGNLDVVEGETAASDSPSPSLLGKRVLDEAGALGYAARACKLSRAAAPVSSAFDSAAASFVARMGKSMLQDAHRDQGQQQQQRLVSEESVLLQKALMEQKAKLHQLQQLQLLRQLQASKPAAFDPVLAQQKQHQQQLLLAQQHLLQQSHGKMLNVLNSAASVPRLSPWSALLKQQASGTAGFIPLLADGNVQQMMNGALASSTAGRTLPPLHPVPPAMSCPGGAFAAGGADLNSCAAAAVAGLGPLGHPAFQTCGLGFGEEKKVKRMQSNRTSAKRSRQRRQARMEELDKTTNQLHSENAAMCAKLEEAHLEIQALEEKNHSLVGEVTRLRKVLGLETADKPNVLAGFTASGACQQQSCIDSEGSTRRSVPANVASVKVEAKKRDVEDVHEDEVGGSEAGNLDWLDSLPLSPSRVGDVKPGSPFSALLSSENSESPVLGPMLVQEDVFSELLACLDA